MDTTNAFLQELARLKETGNLRSLPEIAPDGKWIQTEKGKLLNLSSNDYLGLAGDLKLRNEFLNQLSVNSALFSSTSSRLLTGNYPVYQRVENLLAQLYHAEAALFFSSGYHMNMGILPAISDSNTLILADKLVHASMIDGIRLSAAKCIRFRHQDYQQLAALVEKYHNTYSKIIVVTESIFSMDGDVAPLTQLVALKRAYTNVLLYVDEAHAVGARGIRGLGIAEEQNCIQDIDFLCGTMGKALASMGAYVICSQLVKDYLINKMRTLIFTTALPPVQMEWTEFVLKHIADLTDRRKWLHDASAIIQETLVERGYSSPSASQILPMIIGSSQDTIIKAEDMQRKGFYVLPVRPPTVPEGTSRLRISLTASITPEELLKLKEQI